MGNRLDQNRLYACMTFSMNKEMKRKKKSQLCLKRSAEPRNHTFHITQVLASCVCILYAQQGWRWRTYLVSRHQAAPTGTPTEDGNVSGVWQGHCVLLLVLLIKHYHFSSFPANSQNKPCRVPAQWSGLEGPLNVGVRHRLTLCGTRSKTSCCRKW